MDYEQMASSLIPLVGGNDNIKGVTHCISRLRFSLTDYSQIDEAALKALPGVIGLSKTSDQIQVVIGDRVMDVYDEVLRQLPRFAAAASGKGDTLLDERDGSPGRKRPDLFGLYAETMSAIIKPFFMPMCACGLVTGFRVLLENLGAIQSGDPVSTILTVFGDIIFVFMPFFFAITAADRFKCERAMALLLVGVLMHPTWMRLLELGMEFRLFGVIEVPLIDYSSTIIPPILTVYILSKVERFLKRVVPASLRLVLIPVLELVAVGPIALFIIGPLGNWFAGLLANGYEALYAIAAVPSSILFAAAYPLLVMTGMHMGFGVLIFRTMAELGVDYIFPLTSLANIALAASSLAVFFKTKNNTVKSLAGSGALVTGIGITEPALYGIALRYRRVLAVSMISAGVGGMIFGIFRVTCLGFGLTPLGAFPIFFTDTLGYCIIGHIVTAVIAFAATWIYGYSDQIAVETL